MLKEREKSDFISVCPGVYDCTHTMHVLKRMHARTSRGVQRPVHPILSIGARASGGPKKGPCIVWTIFFFEKLQEKSGKKKKLCIILKKQKMFYICLNPLGNFRGLGAPGL